MTRRAPSPMWIEISVGISLKAGPPHDDAWTIAALAARHGFDEAAVMRAVGALADEGHAEAIALKANMIVVADPAPGPRPEQATHDAEGAAPGGSDVAAPSATLSPAKASDDGAVLQTAAPEGASRLAGGRTPAGAGEVPSLAAPAPISPITVAIETAMLAEPEDGFAFLRRKWPELLHRVIVAGRAEAEAPGPMLARVIDAGLVALADGAAA